MKKILSKIIREIKRVIRHIKRRCKYVINPPKQHVIESSVYNVIYCPHYNPHVKLASDSPDIYNIEGRKMETFFIRNIHTSRRPYSGSKYFNWDRYNIGLDTHFYSHNSMLETMGTPTKKYGMLFEAPSIVPNDYRIFEKHKGLEKDFDAIFTYDENILNNISNAKFFPFGAGSWVTLLPENVYQKKDKLVSMMCSNKMLTDLHRIRHLFAAKAQELNVDVFGTFNNGDYLANKSDSLEKYFYQITVENGLEPYYFTEKIIDC